MVTHGLRPSLIGAYSLRIQAVTHRFQAAVGARLVPSLERMDASDHANARDTHPRSWLLPSAPDPRGWVQEWQDEALRAARAAAEDVIGFSRRAHLKALERAVGVRVHLGENWLGRVVDEFSRLNAGLITGISERMADEIAAETQIAVANGMSPSELAGRIESMFLADGGVGAKRAQTRARIIARDQMNKLNSELTRIRASQIGVTDYRWVTQHDERVRPTHQQRDGKKFSWEKSMQHQLAARGLSAPPDAGHPGEEIMCRCRAEPILDGLYS
jgi:SPP1 gp7 family putative phage head morphogenesis protein